METPISTSFSRKTTDFVLYADDANIEYNDNNEILPKLQTYIEIAEPDIFFFINWIKVSIHIMNKGGNKYKGHIEKSTEPYCNIKYATKAKILGHIAGATNNINDAIDDRIQKSNTAWEILKGKLLGKKRY